MLSLALIAMLLPSYPSASLPNIPDQIRLAQQYESINPYTCIQYATNYLVPKNSDTQSAPITNSQRLYALNTIASCQITAEEISSAQKTIELASSIRLKSNSINDQLLILTEHNRKRIHIYELTQNSIKSHDSTTVSLPEFQGSLRLEDFQTYSYLLNAISSIHAGNYIEAGSTINYLNKTKKIDSSNNYNLMEMLYLTQSYFYQQTNEYDQAFNYLGQLYNLYQKNEQSFYAAITAREMAAALARSGFFKHAAYFQRIYLKNIERIPEYKIKYVRGLAELTNFEIESRNPNSTYSMLLKSEMLLNNSTVSNNDLAFAHEQLGYAFKMLEDRPRAIKYLESASEIFRTEKSVSNYTQTVLNLAELYIDIGKNDSAQKLLDNLTDLAPQLPLEEQLYTKFLFAKLYAAKKNYRKAYTVTKSMFLQDPNFLQDTQLAEKLLLLINKNNISNEPIITRNTENNVFDQVSSNDKFINLLAEDTGIITYILLLVSLIMFLLFSITKRENILYRKELSIYKNSQTLYRNLELPGENDLISYLFSLNFNNKLEGKKTEHTLPQEKEIFNIFLPCFTKLAIEKGNDTTKQIERILIDKITQLITPKSGRIYRISKDRCIIIKDKSSDSNSQQSCTELMKNIQQFLTEQHLSDNISIGAIEYPFLINSTMELTESKLLELALLALHASCYITEMTGKSSWVLLPSISIEKKFPLSGDIREIAVEAFERGILHFYVSHGRELVNWGQLINSQNKI